MHPRTLHLLAGLAAAAVVAGCTSVSGASPSTAQVASADAICAAASRQLATLPTGGEVRILQCAAQSNGDGEVAMVFALNDWMEWTSLISTQDLEDVMFTLPLSLVAYAFGGAREDPADFDRILVSFDDDSQTVYDIAPDDLRKALTAQTADEAEAALRELRETMQITSLG